MNGTALKWRAFLQIYISANKRRIEVMLINRDCVRRIQSKVSYALN